jgi:hypothetical protein
MIVASGGCTEVPQWQSVASSSEAALLDYAGPVDGAHVAVLGDRTLEVMCSLIRRGCAAAVELSLHEHEHAMVEPAEIAVVPRLGSIEQAKRAVALASRLLQSGGQIVLRDTTGLLALHVTALLRMRGFSRVRVRVLGDGTMIRAERPGQFARAA